MLLFLTTKIKKKNNQIQITKFFSFQATKGGLFESESILSADNETQCLPTSEFLYTG